VHRLSRVGLLLSRLGLLLAGLLVAAGCAGPAPTAPASDPLPQGRTPPPGGIVTAPPPPPSPSGTDPTARPGAPGEPTSVPTAEPTAAIVPPALDGPLTCGAEDKQFPAAALAGPGGAENAASQAAAALRRYGGSQAQAEEPLPATGWHAVIEEPARVVFVARADGRWWLAEFVRGEDGAWQDMDHGQCSLAVVLPDGIGHATWRLDPTAWPGEGDTTLHLLATEIACASGRPIGGRMLEPIVLQADGAVTIALRVRTQPGEQTCQGNPEQAVSVELAAPLGARVVLDGSAVPPATRGGSGPDLPPVSLAGPGEEPIPVVVHDPASIATAVRLPTRAERAAAFAAIDEASGIGAVAQPGVVVVAWGGSPCDTGVDISLAGAREAPAVVVRPHPRAACDAVWVGRAIAIEIPGPDGVGISVQLVPDAVRRD